MTKTQKTFETLGSALGSFLTNAIASDMEDPDFWVELGLDQDKFIKALNEDGAMVDLALTFSSLVEDGVPESTGRGITGGPPELIAGTLILAPFGD